MNLKKILSHFLFAFWTFDLFFDLLLLHVLDQLRVVSTILTQNQVIKVSNKIRVSDDLITTSTDLNIFSFCFTFLNMFFLINKRIYSIAFFAFMSPFHTLKFMGINLICSKLMLTDLAVYYSKLTVLNMPVIILSFKFF